MIQLKQLLCEQLGDRNAVFKQAGADRYGVVSPFNAKKIAKLIYDSKSFFNDYEVLVKNVIVKNIKNIKQYGDVNTELQKLKQQIDKLKSMQKINDQALPDTVFSFSNRIVKSYSDYLKSNSPPVIAFNSLRIASSCTNSLCQLL
jgi:hypothetical protein